MILSPLHNLRCDQFLDSFGGNEDGDENDVCRGIMMVHHHQSDRKELALLTHLVKLRRSCQQMILPDIRKCSKSDQIMGANRY